MFNRWMHIITLLTLALAVSISSSVDSLINTRDIPYIDDGDLRHTLDIYLPETITEPVPIIFMLHGGGFIFGSKAVMEDGARYFAEQGYGVVASNYRLAPDYTYPAQIEDSFCALAWTLTHAADYNLDPTRVILLGESAGANAAAMLGTIDEPARFLRDCPDTLPETYDPLGVVAYYMPADLSTCDCFPAKRMVATYFDVEIETVLTPQHTRDSWYEATPLAWLDATDPPFLLIHGEDDIIIPISEAEYFTDVARTADVPTELIRVADGRHGFFTAAFASEATQTSLPQVLATINDWARP